MSIFTAKYKKKQDLRVHWQGGRSCAKAHRAFAEKFGFGRKILALAYAILSRFTHFLEDRGLGVNRCFFGTTIVFLGQEVHYYMVYIAYHTELNLQI